MTWTIDGCISMQNLDIVRGDNRIAMLDCENEALCDDDIIANARLIAAAPDLLAALIDAVAMMDAIAKGQWNWDGSTEGQAKSVARDAIAAIAKARGN